MIKFSYSLDIDLNSEKPVSEISDEALKIIREGLEKIQQDVDSLNERVI